MPAGFPDGGTVAIPNSGFLLVDATLKLRQMERQMQDARVGKEGVRRVKKQLRRAGTTECRNGARCGTIIQD